MRHAGTLEAENDIVQNGFPRKQVIILKYDRACRRRSPDLFSAYDDIALRRSQMAGKDLDDCRFTDPAGADNSEYGFGTPALHPDLTLRSKRK